MGETKKKKTKSKPKCEGNLQPTSIPDLRERSHQPFPGFTHKWSAHISSWQTSTMTNLTESERLSGLASLGRTRKAPSGC